MLIVQIADQVGAVAQVARVAVAIEHDRAGLLVGIVPAVQPRAVGRVEPGVFNGQAAAVPIAAARVPVAVGEPRRMKDERVFQAGQRALGPLIGAASSRFVGDKEAGASPPRGGLAMPAQPANSDTSPPQPSTGDGRRHTRGLSTRSAIEANLGHDGRASLPSSRVFSR